MENNIADSGSRMTRSLRKRLTSVDSENSSRPGTPISAKLTSFSEITTSPSISKRITRRNSISNVTTPVKTPAKRGVATSALLENLENCTPPRRTTRRHSVSVNDNEENVQMSFKVRKFPALEEEIEDSYKQNIRVTRSQSKSPQEFKTTQTSPKKSTECNDSGSKEIIVKNVKIGIPKKRKPGPKSKTYGNDDLFDVEVTSLKNYASDCNNKSPITTISLCDDDDLIHTPMKCGEENENEINGKKSTEIKSDSELSFAVNDGEKCTAVVNDLHLEENINESSSLNRIEQKNDTSNVENITEPLNKNCQQQKSEETTKSQQSKGNDNFETQNLNTSTDNKQEVTSMQRSSIIEASDMDEGTPNISTGSKQKVTNVQDLIDAEESRVEEKKLNVTTDNEQKVWNVQDLTDKKEPDIEDNNVSISTDSKKKVTNEQNSIDIKEISIEDTNLNNSTNNKKKATNAPDSNDIKETSIEEENLNISTDNKKNLTSVQDSIGIDEYSIKENTLNIPTDNMEKVTNVQDSTDTGEKNSSISTDSKATAPKVRDSIDIEESSTNGYKINLSFTEDFEFNVESNIIYPLNITDYTTPKAKETIQSEKVEIIDVSTLPPYNHYEDRKVNISAGTTSMKKVDFVGSPNIMSIQIVYPKTPKKVNIPKEIKSSRKGDSFEAKSNSLIPDNNQNVVPKSEDNQGDGLKSSQTLVSGDASPIVDQNAVKESLNELKESPCGEITEADEPKSSTNKMLDNNEIDSLNGNRADLKWTNPCVRGTAVNGSKLDVVVSQNNINTSDFCDNQNASKKSTQKKVSSEDEEEQEQETDEEEFNESAPEEYSYERKHDFEDEAIEMKYYESGDSMDSEERMEIEENEIPIYAESIGSHTTESDHDENSEEQDNDDDSFIVSDTEEPANSESDNEDIEEVENREDHNGCNSKKNKRTYKRLLRSEESSSSDEKENVDQQSTGIKDIRKNQNEGEQQESHKENLISQQIDVESAIEMKQLQSETIESNSCESIAESHNILNMSSESIIVDPKKLSDSALQLLCSAGSESEDEGTDKLEQINISRKEFLRDLDQSERFNKSVYNLNPELAEDGHTLLSEENAASTEKHECGQSFSIDVTVKRGEMGTADDDRKNERLKSKDENNLKNVTCMSSLLFGNPLIRTRRQSLALPTNPDMEICSTSQRKTCKSFGVLSSIDFNPSQSLVDSIEVQNNERNQSVAKRKRLSKSFCGASEAHDNSKVDIDVRHLHKKSKLAGESSFAESYDSIDNINSSKPFTKISSTPYEKINKYDSYNNNQRILRRCDEILEAANLAKLKDKIRNKKNKIKKSKKISKKKCILTSSDEVNSDGTPRRVSKDVNHKDKTKIVLTHAIKAADVILAQKGNPHTIMKAEHNIEDKRLALEVLAAIGEPSVIKKKCKKKNIHSKEEMENVHISHTSAGNVRELPQSPEKERKPQTYIHLATGKVSVELVTPNKRKIQTLNGMAFRESPITPSASGFKVRQISHPEGNDSPSSALIKRKRKRYNDDSFKDYTLSKSQWSKSGVFIEENVSKNRQTGEPASTQMWRESKKTKKRVLEWKEQNVNRNFKENAMIRPDVKRCSKREICLLKERKQVRDHY